jgi:hypothetical protein
MESLKQNFAQYFRGLQILFFGLLAGQILMCGVCWYVRETRNEPIEFQEDAWLQGIALLSLAAVGGSLLLRKKMMESARGQSNLMAKFAGARTASITGWAMTEAATLINAVFFFLSSRSEYLYTAAAVIVFFATQLPVRAKIIGELELSSQEEASLDNPDNIVIDLPSSED